MKSILGQEATHKMFRKFLGKQSKPSGPLSGLDSTEALEQLTAWNRAMFQGQFGFEGYKDPKQNVGNHFPGVPSLPEGTPLHPFFPGTEDGRAKDKIYPRSLIRGTSKWDS